MIRFFKRFGGLALCLGLCLAASEQTHAQSLDFTLLGRYSTGIYDAGSAEIAAYDALTKRLYFVNAADVEVVVLNIADPSNPSLIHTIDVSTEGGSANSLAIYNGVLAVAVEAAVSTNPGRVVFYDSTFTRLGSAQVGVLPDMIVFTPDGQKVLTANEGQPSANLGIDPEGSISIIDVSGGFVSPSVTTAHFQAFNGQKASLITQGVRLYGIDSTRKSVTVAQDLEPEYIAIASDSKTAWVTLQENNALAIVDIDAGTVTAIQALGFKDHSQPGNGLDASDRDNAINIRPWPVLGMYQPDGIASFDVNGQTYLITANEGDARAFEETRVSSLTLDPTAFPNASDLKKNEWIGRLRTTKATGDTDGDGDFDEIHTFGARSFSIWDESGQLIFDSGDDFERITASLFPFEFNSNNNENDTFDSRSDDKGPEPEGVVIGKIGSRSFAFIGLERIGGVMAYEVTDPLRPVFVDYFNTRDFSFTGDISAQPDGAGDLGPEGLVFIPAASSPNGSPLLITSNEISGTIAIIQVSDYSEFTLTILHNNDSESQLLDLGGGLESYGGVARFKAKTDALRREGEKTGGVVMLSSGDNFLAGPEFNVSLNHGVPFFDATALDMVGYDAMALGNHEFDFGPDVLADFINSFTRSDVRFLSANLDVSREPNLKALADAGRIARSAIINVRGVPVGVVGATTPQLTYISSPRDVVVEDDVAAAVQAEVDNLTAQGVKTIILISHLQSITEDLALIPNLSGVDVVIAGGGDELLADPGDLLVPGDERLIYGAYPQNATDRDNRSVPVITTKGQYGYVGRLVVTFDNTGAIIAINDALSGPVRVVDIAAESDGVTPDSTVNALVTDPVADAVETLANNVIARSEVNLDGRRSSVRNFETNEGNLIADALLWQATKLADDFGAPVPQVAMQNGGGIRNDAIIRSGPITELDTFDMLPFANFVAIVENISPGPFKEILENAVSVRGGGRYGQFSGFRMIVDPTRTAQVLNSSGIVTTPGRRVREVVLNTGQVIVRNGSVVPGAPSITVATIDFLARGGDQYPFRGATFTTLGVTYQQALRNYLEDPEGLDGTVSSALYAENVIRRALELSAPRITSVRDVPNDQGKQAQVTWSASRNDGVLTLPSPAAPPATRYTVWRRDTVAGASTWTAMADITPAGLVSYSAVVPTLFDSTSSGMAYSAFYVTAHTPDPLLTASSDPDSGFSVDNLKPSTPSGIFPKVTAGRIELNWKQPEDKDFRFFAVYRSASSGFTPSSLADTIGTTTDTTFVDTDVTDVNQYFYRVSAFDFSGNESNRSVEIAVALSPTGVDESAGPPIPDSYALSQNRPNPFNPSTTIQYALPHSGEVRLVIYNVLGQEIRTLVNGLQQAGYYTMTWDGRDNAGRVAGSGVYLYRITAGAFQQTRRMTLLK